MSLIKKPTRLELEGVGALTVRPSDYVTQGGEGAIYRKGDRILKLALDRQKFAQTGMPDKVKLLRSSLSHPSIVVPSGMVLDHKGRIVGMHLPYVEGEPYPRLFTNDWRGKNRFGDTEVTKLAATMHDVVDHTHQAGALMVDGNELNWLANLKNARQPVPYIIDVDSWQINRFKANMVMPSIRDWHSPLSPSSDWFAWGVVTFLLYTGIHPYKGKLTGYKAGNLEQRMKDNASVFCSDVKLNRNVRGFSSIPGPLLDWYQATFEAGERTMPPSPLQSGRAQTAIGRVMRAVVTTTGGLVYDETLRLTGEEVISVWPCGVARTDTGKLVEVASKRVIAQVTGRRAAVVAENAGYLIAEDMVGDWNFRFVTRGGVEHQLSLGVPVTNVVRSGERLFAISDTELIELTLQAFARPVLTTGRRWQVLGNSTKWFGGVGVSDVLGAMHLVVPYGDDGVVMVRTPELDSLRIVNARGHGRIAVVATVDQSGQYQVYEFAGSDEWKSHNMTVRDVDGLELNLTILPKGVTAEIREDGELVISVPTQGAVKVVPDKDLLTTMQLGNIDNQVVYRKDGALWSLRMT